MIEAYNINDISPNPSNPRIIKDAKFDALVKSIQEFPDMTMVRPLIINQDNVIIGGNMRYMAMKQLEFTTVPCQKVDWDEERQKEFLIKDNLNFGEWNWDDLANDFNQDDLSDWGLELPKMTEVDEESEPTIESEKIILEYSTEEYHQVKQALSKIASTPEQAVWKLLQL
jgi:ParB-like chromosome segregation protein Spo0J